MAENETTLTNNQKAAILLISLENEAPGITTNIFSKMGEDRSKKIIKTISEMGKITLETVSGVINEFYGMAIEQNIVFGGKGITEKILKQSFGISEQQNYFSEQNILFDFLKTVSTKDLISYFEEENNQMVALVCNFLNEDRVAKIIDKLSAERSSDLSKLMVKISPPNQALLWRLQNLMIEKLILKTDASISKENKQIVKLARILEQLNAELRISILANIQTENKDLFQKIQSCIFTFDDLIDISEKDLQTILYEVESLKTLAYALKGLDERFYQKIKSNISNRVNMILDEEIESLPLDLTEEQISQARNEIVQIARKAEKDNKIEKLQTDKEE